MNRRSIEITPERAEVVRWAVQLSGGQRETAKLLRVTPATVSRWTSERGPIPQAVVLWAKQVLATSKDIADLV